MNECELISGDEVPALFGRWLPTPLPACALAVSGGSDSIALMALFADWLRAAGGDPACHAVLTVDHGLRPEAAGEAEQVAIQAAALGFRHRTLHWEGHKPATGIQAAARATRYRLIHAQMVADGDSVLLTGHTRDDQAETLLMRLGRGSGLDGLAGMAPRLSFGELGLAPAGSVGAELEIVRPLLGMPRSRLRATLQARGMPWIDDPSNSSMNFERPRLRALRTEREALGLTDPMLALSAMRLLRARRAIEGTVDEFCRAEKGAVSVHPTGYIRFDRGRLSTVEEEIALRALGRAIAACGGGDEPSSLAKLESLTTAVRGRPVDATWTLARALITGRANTVTVEREPGREPLPALQLAPGTHAIWDGRFRVSADAAEGGITVRALGETAARQLRRQDFPSAEVPARVASFVPAFWCGDRLLAAPSLQFWADPALQGALTAHFIGSDLMAGRRPGKVANGSAT
jgi:tRNA(Ile)-lysidine synthase